MGQIAGQPTATPFAAGAAGVPGAAGQIPVKESPAPKVIGVLMMILGVLSALGSIYNFTQIGSTVSMMAELDIELNATFLYLTEVVKLAVAGGYVAGGFMLFNKQKMGVWIGLGAVGLSAINGVAGSIIMGSAMGEMGGLVAGAGLAGTVVCNGICAAIIAIPLMMSSVDLE